jgi:cytochrome c
MHRHRRLILLLGCGAALAAILGGSEPDGATRGREIFEKRCTGCHALDGPKVGPPLRGIFGRRAASDPRFPYSDALKKTQFAWDEARLDRWLADPDALIPDSDMSFRLDNAAERAAIIAYLKQLPAK